MVALAIGAAASVAGAYMSSKAQSKAAGQAGEASFAAQELAVAEQRRQFDLTRADFAPWRETGQAALQRLSEMFLGVSTGGTPSTTRQVTETGPGQPKNTQEINRLQNLINQADREGIPTELQGTLVNGAPYTLNSDPQYQAWKKQLAELKQGPASTTRTITEPGTPGSTAYPDYSEFYKSPGYNFRMDEGINALDRSASARGRLTTPGFGREITRYGQGVASNEFNAYANRLASMAGVGQSATGATAAAGQSSANAISSAYQAGGAGQANALMAAGNATASGYAGAASGINSGIQNYMLQQYLNK